MDEERFIICKLIGVLKINHPLSHTLDHHASGWSIISLLWFCISVNTYYLKHLWSITWRVKCSKLYFKIRWLGFRISHKYFQSISSIYVSENCFRFYANVFVRHLVHCYWGKQSPSYYMSLKSGYFDDGLTLLWRLKSWKYHSDEESLHLETNIIAFEKSGIRPWMKVS